MEMKPQFNRPKKVCVGTVSQNFFNGLCRIAALHNESVLDVTNRAVNEFLDYEEGITPEQLAQRLAEIEAEQGE